MAKQTLQLGRRWYVIHTYSGLEEAVEHNLSFAMVHQAQMGKA